MDKAFTTVEIGSKICHVCQYDSRADGSVCHKRPIFYWGIDSRNKKRIMTTMSCLESRLKEKPLDAGFLIVAYESEKWNDDFSPWKAQAAFGNDGFGGNADRTLEWLVNQCIPYIEAEDSVYIKNDTKVQRYTVGYSLAGLFGLWAYAECRLFAGAASCSGSLWYAGWPAYAEKHQAAFCRNKTDCIYLSLGDKEERAKNSLLSTVGDNTRKLYDMLRALPSGAKTTLEWNAGGHFCEPDIRVARGIYWILSSSGV